MSITDKTRKVLWGRSGNRCGICKHQLVLDSTPADDESIVGDECHIVSSRSDGPRHDPSYPQENLDSYENLILLCRVHHKMVDDQEATYTAAILRQMRVNHELWVSDRLTEKQRVKPLRLRRVKRNIPGYLLRLTTGKHVLDVMGNAYTGSTHHDELRNQEEVDLVGGFLQAASDWGEMWIELEPSTQVSATYELTRSLHELEQAGFFVFGGREVQILEGGIQDEPSAWPVAILWVLRQDSESIIHINLDKTNQKDVDPTEAGDKQ